MTPLSIPSRNRNGSALPRLLSVDSVAAELDVSTKTVRRWISTERLPTHRLGRQIRISEADLRGGSGNLDKGAEWRFCLTAARMAAEQERR